MNNENPKNEEHIVENLRIDDTGKKKILTLSLDDYTYFYLKFMSAMESLPINAILTVMVEEDMQKNKDIVGIYNQIKFLK
ncbi:hypothetical protein P40081_24505 [Paenibacillus sp. FSL P4-0081]|uniref:hypothetical protein n=1 Tax=Paenibacillus sp. FSL P4-0081 TaxID=1536769 RepID=UPI0004F62A2B|nr:hypothetical protein [Paenibacillus sp. FSL P4-0081]AIQ30976.1 hypothetical protein P40081_24505 [Paenibacillus sp. FSL P4-0081]